MINKIIKQLKTDYNISDDILNKYHFELKGNKLFIMTSPAHQFNKIKPVRKGLLFAIIKGQKLYITDNTNLYFTASPDKKI